MTYEIETTCNSSSLWQAGETVRLTSYHKDNRPTTIRSAGLESCVLEEPRGGYYTWNYADIEPYKG